jgi:hypothetical protein
MLWRPMWRTSSSQWVMGEFLCNFFWGRWNVKCWSFYSTLSLLNRGKGNPATWTSSLANSRRTTEDIIANNWGRYCSFHFFYPLRKSTRVTAEINRTHQNYHNISAWHRLPTRTANGLGGTNFNWRIDSLHIEHSEYNRNHQL